MATCTLNSGTTGISGGNSGYQLAVGATGKTASGPWSASPGYPYKITSVSVPWFGYTTGGTLSISGTVTITIKSGSTTIGSLSGSVSSTIYSNTNITGSVSCTGTVNCASGTSYTLVVSCSGGSLLKSGVRFTTNGKSLTVNYSAQTYVVSYSANGRGTAPAAQTKTAGTTLTLQPYIASQYTDSSEEAEKELVTGCDSPVYLRVDVVEIERVVLEVLVEFEKGIKIRATRGDEK